MYYGEIKNCDIANGEGVRVTLFVSGCTNHCEHCFQPQTWDFDYGQPFTSETEQQLLDLLAPSYIQGLTLLGGEPFEPEYTGRKGTAEEYTANAHEVMRRAYALGGIECR